MYKKYFCTFADSRMKKSLARIEAQARDFNFFDEISVNDENDLDPDFREYFKDKLIKGSRGYGYWVWKPQIILQTLKKMNDGDILLYTDVGCHLNEDGLKRLIYYFKQTELSKSGLFVFQEAVNADDKNLEVFYSNVDKIYTKGDVFDYFKVRDDEYIYNTGMIVGTIVFIKKHKKSQEMIEKWLNVFKDKFNLVDDTPSVAPNFNGFIENRHDQSIFSILCKLNKVPSISSYEMWQPDWNKLVRYPIWAKRDKRLTFFPFLKQKISSVFSKSRLFISHTIRKNSKINKFLNANNKERKIYFIRFIKKIYIFILPFIRIFAWLFVSYKDRRNIFMDLLERVTNIGPIIRYRYYFGYKMFYSCLDEVGTGIVNNTMCNRTYEKDTCDFLQKSLSGLKHSSFIDVGANIGLISLYMLKNVQNTKIYAFEPSPHQYGLFKRTITENNISDKIELYDLALSDREGEFPFFAHTTGCPADGFIDTGRGGSGKTILVKALPLDIWWKDKGKPKIDLIKIDTEGAELLVLKGAKELLSECQPDIFFEMQEINYKVYGYSYKDILSFFYDIGYLVYNELGIELNFENATKLMMNNYNFIAKKLTK